MQFYSISLLEKQSVYSHLCQLLKNNHNELIKLPPEEKKKQNKTKACCSQAATCLQVEMATTQQ